MTTSEGINEIAAALVKAQAAMKNAPLNKINPHFRSKYADLAGIRDAVIPALAAQGIAVVQTLDAGAENVAYCVLTRLIHTSGQWIESLCPIPSGADMQKMGSAITYARRYSLSAICAIAADDDDDANDAVAGQLQQPQAAPSVPAGYQDWWDDLTATADNGTKALETAWKPSNADFKTYTVTANKAAWEALKKRAAGVAAS